MIMALLKSGVCIITSSHLIMAVKFNFVNSKDKVLTRSIAFMTAVFGMLKATSIQSLFKIE